VKTRGQKFNEILTIMVHENAHLLPQFHVVKLDVVVGTSRGHEPAPAGHASHARPVSVVGEALRKVYLLRNSNY
jgi:hypothetical protein